MGLEQRVYRRERLEGAWDSLVANAQTYGITEDHLEAARAIAHRMQCHWEDELQSLHRRGLQRPMLPPAG
jgi:hypothetical protein